MLKNYLRIAFRNLGKYKFISFVNLFGLTVGLSCCLLILSYILNELSYDRYNPKAGSIYRVTRSFLNGEGVVTLHLSSVAPVVGPLLQNDFPDIQKFTRLLATGATPFRYKDKIFNEKGVYFADGNFTDLFDVALTAGDPATALRDPNTLLLTEEGARKYFGVEDPMNKTIRINNQLDLKVTGVYKEFPANAHIHPEMLISFNTLNDPSIYGAEKLHTSWDNNAFLTYLLLPANYPAKNLEAQFPAFLDKHMSAPGQPTANKPSKYTSLSLQKLTDIHLRSHLDDEAEENGDINRVYIFSAIALFILLIACINYMNLSTARSTLRAKEIGIRKVSGARRGEIIAQFLIESVLITWLATILAISITWLALPWLNKITGQTLSIRILYRPDLLITLLLTPFAVGLISGLYPAFFMSSFQPAKVLKGLFKAGGGSISFRKALVVTQFSISIILIISTAIVFSQLNYIRNSALGLDKDHILTFRYDRGLNTTYETFRNEALRNANIRDLARSSRIPSGRLLDEQGASMQNGDSLRPVNADIKYLVADQDFVPTYGISLAAGRNFSRDYATDTASFLLNEAATKILGLSAPGEAVGKNFVYGAVKGKIVGVLNDFHFESMHQKILPMILVMPSATLGGNPFGRISVKVSGGDLPGAISHLEATWKKFLPEAPFEYSFLDERFNDLYRSEQRQGALFTAFAGIAIFIACLGLFGLASFAITQRVKEIGIRKVLGASTSGIVALLSGDFMKLVAIAALIAFPVAGYAMNKWLQDFAYRIDMPWWIFLLAGILAALVALITIGLQAVRAALANPATSLRSE
jgi:putative ABC transport system permease protein